MTAPSVLPFGLRVHPRPSPNHGSTVGLRWVRCVVWHISEGPLHSTLDWLRNPASQASSNYVIARDGTVYGLVPPSRVPWTNGKVCDPDLSNPIVASSVHVGVDPNAVSVTIECVGYSSWGRGGSLTLPQAIALVHLTAAVCLKYHLTADRAHIIPHSAWDSCTRSGCPGFSEHEWEEWVRQVAVLLLAERGW